MINLFGMNHSQAQLSPCRSWRYTLERFWGPEETVAFLMFNPSTADESLDDPTIRKCRGFAQRWGYGAMVIVNLFAIRGSDPEIVSRVADPVGPLNNWHIREAVLPCEELICAWGCSSAMKGALQKRPGEVLRLIEEMYSGIRINCLGYNADRSPRHPLMLAYATPRERFVFRGGE